MASGDLAVTALLAEYSALRAEIDRRSQAQQTLSNLALTLSGALVAYAIDKNALFVLLLQPVAASTLGMLYADHVAQIKRIGRYIAEHTAIRVVELTGVPRLLEWEQFRRARAQAWRPFWTLQPFLTFVGTATSVLVLCFRRVWLATPTEHGLIAPSPWATRYLWLFGAWTTAACAVGLIIASRTRVIAAASETSTADADHRRPRRTSRRESP